MILGWQNQLDQPINKSTNKINEKKTQSIHTSIMSTFVFGGAANDTGALENALEIEFIRAWISRPTMVLNDERINQ
eukprot:m.128247 g.128247  ORF g.128247 m.128247 type:complete len:76 (-) comp13022_c0_seq6:70-297(-)